jgi:acetyl-CoA carboxylase biotin carboxyl carrier protein
MGLSDADVREILRLIDESELDELRIETADFKLHVLRGGAAEDPLPAPAVAPAGAAASDGAHTIEAPMLGTFYCADSPGADPFVQVGARVEPDTVVGIIEVMKMMNSVQAGVSGTVVEVCAEDAEFVEEGAPLFRVQTS